ncbi:unnamed protein product, partial [Callosobruchus maculatus]
THLFFKLHTQYFTRRRCSIELYKIITPQAVQTRKTREALRAHPYHVEVLTPRTSLLRHSFFWRTSTLWNQLPGNFSITYYDPTAYCRTNFITIHAAVTEVTWLEKRVQTDRPTEMRDVDFRYVDIIKHPKNAQEVKSERTTVTQTDTVQRKTSSQTKKQFRPVYLDNIPLLNSTGGTVTG